VALVVPLLRFRLPDLLRLRPGFRLGRPLLRRWSWRLAAAHRAAVGEEEEEAAGDPAAQERKSIKSQTKTLSYCCCCLLHCLDGAATFSFTQVSKGAVVMVFVIKPLHSGN